MKLSSQLNVRESMYLLSYFCNAMYAKGCLIYINFILCSWYTLIPISHEHALYRMRWYYHDKFLLYSLHFIYWATTMTILSLALLLGAKSDDSTVYTTSEDYFRAVCEALMLFLITMSFIRDILLISMWAYNNPCAKLGWSMHESSGYMHSCMCLKSKGTG